MRDKDIETTNINFFKKLTRRGRGREGIKARGDFRIKGEIFRNGQT